MFRQILSLVIALCFMVATLYSCANQEAVDSAYSSDTITFNESATADHIVEHQRENELVYVDVLVPLMTKGTFSFEERQLEGADIYEQYCHFTNPIAKIEAGRIFLMCSDEMELNQGNHYTAYIIENGRLVPLEAKQFSMDLNLFTNPVHIELEYVESNGACAITYIASNSGGTPGFNILDISRGPKECLIGLFCEAYSGMTVQYPVLLDLETGKCTDFLSEIAKDELLPMLCGQIYDVAWGDRNRLIIRLSDNNYYYFDPNHSACYSLTELIPQKISDCTLTKDSIIAWNESGNYWQISLETMGVKQFLSNMNTVFSRGISIGNGSSFILHRDSGNLYAFDFVNMKDMLLTSTGGWSLDSDSCYASPDGRKLLVTHGKNGIFQMGIFNCDTAQFISLERNNADGLTESRIFWNECNEIEVISKSAYDVYNYRFF